MRGPLAATAASAQARFPVAGHITVSLLWLALYAQWLTVVPIIIPDQIAGMVGPNNPAKDGISGSIIAAGAAVSLVVVPVAGALSDRCHAPHGRRRPFLISGMLATCAALLLLMPFSHGGRVMLYGAVILNLQFWWNWAAGPYAGLIADVVAVADRSVASGWVNVMTILGTIIGYALAALIYRPGHAGPLLAAFVILNLVCLAATLWFVREPAADGPRRAFKLRHFAASFWLPPRRHANFYWVLATRLMVNMGIWSVFTFLVFYVESVFGLAPAAATRLLPALLGAGSVLAIPASLVGVRLADRHGIVTLVKITSWIMAAATICYLLMALHPDVVVLPPVLLTFTVAYGAYGAVDWALALRVLPAGQDAGKDMGIWHVCMVLPQMLGPAVTGWLISFIKLALSPQAAYATAFGIAALWFTLAAMLVGRIRLPEQPRGLLL